MTTPLVTYHPCKTIEIWAEKSSGRTLSEEDGLYLASDVDPRLAALVEALKEAVDMIESEYCSHADEHSKDNSCCYAQHQLAALAATKETV